MTLEVYLDNVLQATEYEDPATIPTGDRFLTYTYSFGQVVVEYNKVAPYTSEDPSSYDISWWVPMWNDSFPTATNCVRGRYPYHADTYTANFTAEQKRGSNPASIVDMGQTELQYTTSRSYSHMLTSTLKVYFVTVPKTHLIFRDPQTNMMINAGLAGLVRDD